jgi:hypothetical protein
MSRIPTRRLQPDPPEGSRKVIEHELKRQKKDTSPPESARPAGGKARESAGGKDRKKKDRS